MVRLQQAQGDFEGSVEPLRTLLAERRDDPEVMYRYGLALRVTGRPSLAEWSLREAMRDPEYLAPAGLQLAIAALRSNNRAVAIEITTQIVAEQPENLAALLLRAKAYARSPKQYEKALEDADRILELDPENLDVAEAQILALIGLRRIDEVSEAIDALGRRIDEAQLEAGIPAWHCVTAAIFADESGEAELAEERWADCLERYPATVDVVVKASAFYDSRGEFDRSIAILRTLVAQQPSARRQRVTLAERLRQTGEPAEAETVLREAAEAESGEPAALWLDLAKHYQEVADFEAAAAAVERAMELSRERGRPTPELMLEFADALLRAGEFERALQAAEEMTLDAHRAMIRARVAQQRVRPREALEYFDEAFRLWPDNPWARYYAALAAEAIGDFDRAIEEYRYSIRIEPGGTDARTRVARLHLAEGRAAEALQMLRIKRNEAPLDLDAEVLLLQLAARLGSVEPVLGLLESIAQRAAPERVAEALTSAAEGVYENRGPAAALALLRGSQAAGLDLEQPAHAEALRALVRFAHAAGETEVAETAVQAALGAQPDAAIFHEIHGWDLELRGAPDDRIRAAYERAVALEPGSAGALAGLGRLAGERSPEQALELFDRAIAADPGRAEPRREAAEILVARGRSPEAEERLEDLLRRHPFDAAGAARSVELRLARDVADERTLELARRAVRFGGRADALDLLSRVYERRGDPERARKAAEDAKRMRERRARAADTGSSQAAPELLQESLPEASPEGVGPTG